MCFRVPHLCSKIPKINNWTGYFAIVIWRLHSVLQSRSVVTSAENPAPDNSPQSTWSIGELRNGHVANLQELYYTRLVRKMA